MLTVGTDSYVTLEDANSYVEKNYTTSNAYRRKWEQLTDQDKESLLRSSTSAIDQLKFIGAKRSRSQRLQFPRVTMTGLLGGLYYGSANQYYDTGLWDSDNSEDGGLFAVRQATIDNALVAAYVDAEVLTSTINGLRGIKSKSVGPISESYESSSETRGAKRGLYSQKIYTFLNPWLADAFISL